MFFRIIVQNHRSRWSSDTFFLGSGCEHLWVTVSHWSLEVDAAQNNAVKAQDDVSIRDGLQLLGQEFFGDATGEIPDPKWSKWGISPQMAMFIGTMMNLVVPSFQSNIEGTTTLRENIKPLQSSSFSNPHPESSRSFQNLPIHQKIPRPLPPPDSPRFPSWAPLGCWDSASGPSHPAPRRRRCRPPRRPPAPWGVFHYKVWGIVELTIKIRGFSCKNMQKPYVSYIVPTIHVTCEG